MRKTTLSFMIVPSQCFLNYRLQPASCFWNQFGGSCLAFVLINLSNKKTLSECLRGSRGKYFPVKRLFQCVCVCVCLCVCMHWATCKPHETCGLTSGVVIDHFQNLDRIRVSELGRDVSYHGFQPSPEEVPSTTPDIRSYSPLHSHPCHQLKAIRDKLST